MGNRTGRSEEEISDSLEGEYRQETHPYLVHRHTNQLVTLHKITTHSQQQAEQVSRCLDEYSRSRCQSISKLKQYHHLDKQNYCTGQQHFYLLFQGHLRHLLKEEYVLRRYQQSGFTEGEIVEILEAYLSGLREYHHRFGRSYENLCLESAGIEDSKGRVYLRDPWLSQFASENRKQNNISNMLLTYPSPEKLKSAYTFKMQEYDEFLSSLFTVGVIGLQLHDMNFADSVYLQKKQVNYADIEERISKVRSEKLKTGLNVLLKSVPDERKLIYQIWGIENREQHCLERLALSGSDFNSVGMKMSQSIPLSLSNTVMKYCNRTISVTNMYHKPRLPDDKVHLSIHQQKPVAKRLPSYEKIQQIPDIPPPKSQPIYQPIRSTQLQVPVNKPVRPNSTNSHSNQPVNNTQISISIKPSFVASRNPQKHIAQMNYLPVNNLPKYDIIQPKMAKKPFSVESTTTTTSKQLSSLLPISIATNSPKINFTTNHSNILQSYETYKRPTESFSFARQFNDENMLNGLKNHIVNNANVQIKDKDKPQEIVVVDRNVSISISEANTIDGQGNTQSIEKTVQPVETTEAAEKVDSPISETYVNIDEDGELNIRQAPLQNQLRQTHDSTTPPRPTGKNKFNSTIVEVKDQDTPENSSKGSKSSGQADAEYIVQVYETGSRYEGYKLNGMRHGRGKFSYQDGGYYQGQWKNNRMDGWGKLYYEGGRLAYEGNWLQDEFNGLGKVYNDNPAKLTSGFDYSNFEFLEDYWEYYEGMLVNDTKEGRGKIKLSNGEVFEGDFHHDRIQGFGKFYTCNNEVIEGIWRDSRLVKVLNAN